MSRWCCNLMEQQVEYRCETHPDPFDCPDNVVTYVPTFREYGLIIHNGGVGFLAIQFCPWCGTRLPKSERYRWFEELERRGIENPEDAPVDMQSDAWLRGGE